MNDWSWKTYKSNKRTINYNTWISKHKIRTLDNPDTSTDSPKKVGAPPRKVIDRWVSWGRHAGRGELPRRRSGVSGGQGCGRPCSPAHIVSVVWGPSQDHTFLTKNTTSEYHLLHMRNQSTVPNAKHKPHIWKEGEIASGNPQELW